MARFAKSLLCIDNMNAGLFQAMFFVSAKDHTSYKHSFGRHAVISIRGSVYQNVDGKYYT